MAIRRHGDRYTVEFQQHGQRIHRRCPPMATADDARALERELRRQVFETVKLGKQPEMLLSTAIAQWLIDTLPHKKDQKYPPQRAAMWAPFVEGRTLRQAPDAAQEAISAWTAARQRRRSSSHSGTTTGMSDVPVAIRNGLAPSSINRRLAILKATLHHAFNQGWLPENLSGRIKMLPEDNKRHVYLTAAQVRKLSKAAPTSACGSAIMILAYTGLRVAELLTITATPTDSLMVRSAKGGPVRTVPLVPLLRPFVRALPLRCSYDLLHKQFSVARERAGMPHVRIHDLRHSAASMLINAGVALYTVGQILGHRSLATTQRYAHLSDATLRKAVRRLR